MKRTLTKIAAGCASVALLMGATTISASANYLGYANGDPANWDLYQEQHNGASPPAEGIIPPATDYYAATAVRHHRTTHGHLRMERPSRHIYEQ